MKKILSLVLVLAVSACLLFQQAATADSDDWDPEYLPEKLNISYCDSLDGFSSQSGWGYIDGDTDYDTYCEGIGSTKYTAEDGKMMIFLDNSVLQVDDFGGGTFPFSYYDTVEFDLLASQTLFCTFELCLVGDNIAHHGHDWEKQNVAIPDNTFVHFVLPMSEFITRTAANPDLYDSRLPAIDENGHPANELLDNHYNTGNDILRMRYQYTDVTDTDGNELPEFSIWIDNVVVSMDKDYNGVDEYTAAPSTWQTVDEYKANPYNPNANSSVTSEASEASDDSSETEPSGPVTSTDIESSNGTGKEYKYGDVDSDDVVTATDALIALQYSVKKVTFTELQIKIANVDGVDDIAASDALSILQFSVGKITSFDVGTTFTA